MKALFRVPKAAVERAKKKLCFSREAETLRQGLERDLRFPRPCRYAGEFAVGETLAADLSHGELEALTIVQVFAVVMVKPRVQTLVARSSGHPVVAI